MRLAVLVTALAIPGGWSSGPSAPAFMGETRPVRWSDLRFSYRAGCPVKPPQLRTLHVSYWSFDRRPRLGSIVVHRRVAADVLTVFRRLWQERFPIRRLRPVSSYRGSDDASMAADNTSGFNCRFVGGTSRWSMHAFGEAIDINPVENPYVGGSRVSPPTGRAFLDRSRYQPGMAIEGGVLVEAFEGIGWKWGDGFGDYQHFSTTGN